MMASSEALLKPPKSFIIRGTAIETWDAKLSREPGASFFCSAGNQILLAALVIAAVLAARWRRRAATGAPSSSIAWLLLGAAAAWGASLLAFGGAAGSRGAAEVASVVLYELMLACLVIAGLMARRTLAREGGSRLDLLLLIVGGLVVRVLFLEGIPPRIHPEEAAMGLWSRHAAQGRVPELFSTGYFDNPMLHFFIDALLLRWVGDDLWGLRLTSVPVGLLAVVITYRLAVEIWGGRMAPALAGGFAAFHHVLLYYSRNGLHIIDSALTTAGASYLALRAITGGSSAMALLSGVAAGVGVQGYFPNRVAAVVPLALLLASWLAPCGETRREAAKSLGAFALAFVFALGPLGFHFATAPESAKSREEKVIAVSPRGLLAGDSAAWDKLWRNLRMTVRLHTLGQDADPHYGGRTPFLHPLVLPFVLLGAARALGSLREPGPRLLVLWVALTLGLGSLVVNVPRIRRTLAVIPALALLYALGWIAASAWLKRRSLATAVGIGCLAIASADSVDGVLRRHSLQKPIDLPSAAGRYLAAHRGEPIQLLTLPDFSREHRFAELLAPDCQARNIVTAADLVPGVLLVGAQWAPTLVELESLGSATIEWPWGRWPEELFHRQTLLSEDEARPFPPALVTLRERPAVDAVTITTHGDGGRIIDVIASPFPFYAFRRKDRIGLREVTFEAPTDGPSRLSVRALCRSGSAIVSLDGQTIEGDTLEIPSGRHVVAVSVRPEGKGDPIQIALTPR